MKLKAKYQRLSPATRLHGLPVPLVGLTGGIATGKSTVAGLLRERGFAVIDADRLVKDIYQWPETRAYLEQNHPEVLSPEGVDFPRLRELAFSDPAVKRGLEEFLYARLPRAFLEKFEALGRPEVIVYDVPLLFEKNLAPKVDRSVVVYAPRELQLARLIQRDQSTPELAERILAQQLGIEEKRRLADELIQNTGNLDDLRREIDRWITQLFE
jgi:dephospho-CoA kinase